MADRSTSAVLKYALTAASNILPGPDDWTELAVASDGSAPLTGEFDAEALLTPGQTRAVHVQAGARRQTRTVSRAAEAPAQANAPVLNGGASLILSLASVASGVETGGSPITSVAWEIEGGTPSGSVAAAALSTPITVDGVDPGEYRARCRLSNAVGQGPWSDWSLPATLADPSALTWIDNGGAAYLNAIAPNAGSFLDAAGMAIACKLRLRPGGAVQRLFIGSQLNIAVATNGNINSRIFSATGLTAWPLPGGAAANQEVACLWRTGVDLSGVSGRTTEFWVNGDLVQSGSMTLVASTVIAFAATQSSGADVANLAVRDWIWVGRGALFEYDDFFDEADEARNLGASGVVNGQTPVVYYRKEAAFDAGANAGSGGDGEPYGNWSTT